MAMNPHFTRPLPHHPPWQHRLHAFIFEADTPSGKFFDIILLSAILASVAVVMLDSVDSIHAKYETELVAAEWVFTILFSVEYVLRLICTRRPMAYARSFYGIIDLLAVIPTYLTLLLPGIHSESLMVIRSLRLLRTFRIFKLIHFVREAAALKRALITSRNKIAVFLAVVVVLVVIVGSAMYVIEGRSNHDEFSSIPQSIYWAIVTMTTVGYGDISPVTGLGKALAAMMMLIGYAMIIVPTSIVSAEMVSSSHKTNTQVCPSCCKEGHENDAVHCKFCGHKL